MQLLRRWRMLGSWVVSAHKLHTLMLEELSAPLVALWWAMMEVEVTKVMVRQSVGMVAGGKRPVEGTLIAVGVALMEEGNHGDYSTDRGEVCSLTRRAGGGWRCCRR